MTQQDYLSVQPAYFGAEDLRVEDLDAVCSQTTQLADYPLAMAVEKKILIYDGDTVRSQLNNAEDEARLKAEWCLALRQGPGVFVVKQGYPNTSIIDRSTALFHAIVAEEKAKGQGQGDHFGKNERIWNAIEKVCLKDPNLFIDYYTNSVLAIASESWLGPFYQITAQVNNVKPGSKAQSTHRDYHLGFQSASTVTRFPAHAQVMSQYLTLQGAIAHTDMPIETGPTLLLPYSHQLKAGYQAYTLPAFDAYFQEHKVQLPLSKGDMIFFSPALFHGAGSNQSASDRIANLVQISSAFGRTMETVNTTRMVLTVYPTLLARLEQETLTEQELNHLVAAVANGYSFPTNLDSDPPIGGNAPQTEQQLLRVALQEKWTLEQLTAALSAYSNRRQA
ncbi:MAG: phytanoyl-CoA dioxygenase family protein [Phototrophicaceae bacterium]